MESNYLAGRLGALAFAGGVGIALLTGAAAAVADSTESASTESASGSSAAESSSGAAGPERQSGRTDRKSSEDDSAPAASNDPKPTEAVENDSKASEESASADDETSKATRAHAKTSTKVTDPAVSQPVSESPGETADADVTDAAEIPATAGPASGAHISELAQDSVVVPTSATPSAVPVKAPTAADLRSNIALAKWAVFFGYGATEGKDVRGGLPALDNLIEQSSAAWRKLFNPGAPNVAPTATPSQVHQFDSGEVIGDLDAGDRDGDRLTYLVTGGPAHGTVTINSNGTYLYHANTDFMRAGGEDTFAVSIDDGSGRAPTSIVVPVSVTPTLGFDRGYHVDNLYVHGPKVTITNIGGDTNGYYGQPVGFSFTTAERYAWTVREDVWLTQEIGVTFTAPNGTDWRITTKVPPGIGSGRPQVRCTTAGGACAPGGGGFVNSQGSALMDETPMTIALDGSIPDQAQLAGDLLARFCANGKVVGCNFEATGNVATLGNEHTFGASRSNEPNAPTNVTGSSSYGYTVSESDNVSIAVKASGGALTNLLSIINLEITGTYGHTWTKTENFTETVNYNVPPGWTQTYYVADPVWRVTGNFRVTVGNVTMIVDNARFETARTDGRAPSRGLISRFIPYAG